MNKKIKLIIVVVVLIIGVVINTASKKNQSATQNSKMVKGLAETQEESEGTQQENQQNESESIAINQNVVKKLDSTYDCDIEEDKKSYQGKKPDIVVGDNLFATQINDWYMNFDKYEGMTVEIEGYYINEFAPYDFIGRYGPVCPYCQGGYVCFEILTDEDVSGLQNAKDWIKVIGILRKGNDAKQGAFCYLEVISLQVMDQVGTDTVVN